MIDLDALIASLRERAQTDSPTHALMNQAADALVSVRAERDAAEARIAEAAKLHRRRDDLEYRWGGGPVCDGCGDEDGWASKWPCPTAVSLGLNEGDER